MTKKKQANGSGVLELKLKLNHRLRLLGILPPKGGIATARLVRSLIERLSLSPEEIRCECPRGNDGRVREHRKSCLNFQQFDMDGNVRTTWNVEADRGRTFNFGGFDVELIVSRLKKLDQDGELTSDMVELWDMFIGDSK